MDVVVVEDVRAWAQHGGEILAGAGVRLVQKGGLLSVGPLPVAHICERPPVGEREAGHVDRIAEGVFGETRALDVVDRAAAVGAEHVDGRDPLAEAGLGVRLNDVVEPGLQRRDHRAVNDERLVEPDLAVRKRGDFERARHAADAGAVDLAHGNDGLGRGDELAGEAGVFGLGAPDRPLGPAEEAAARQREDGDERQDGWPNATRHRLKLRPFL